MFLHPQNTIPAFSSAQAAGIVVFGLIGSVATIWSISSSRGYSRYFILINTIGVAAVCLTLHFGGHWQEQRVPSLLIMSGIVFPTLWVLFGHRTVQLYYRVIAGDADIAELGTSTEAENRWIDRLGSWITFGAEAFIVVIALFAFIYPFIAEGRV